MLQHPDESRAAKGSAIIAKLCLQQYQCWQGEDFSAHKKLNELLHQHADTTCIVYPSDTAVSLNSLKDVAGNHARQIQHVIFIDATWRKARKIWALSQNLHTLPAVKLEPEENSNYRIRKIPADGYLSTIEAIACCLASLDNAREKYQPLLALFDRMIDFQIDKMGDETYQKNYNDVAE